MNNPVDVSVAVAYNPEKEKFLVLKRADSMEINPGKWNFASGKIKEDEAAEDAALRELEEETGLKGKILRSGDSFVDDTGGKVFCVHPFLVLVKDSGVTLNSEHSEFRWIDADELDDIDGLETLGKNFEKLDIDT
ncbi:NUDIX domain-containing protein [Candidatus Nanosalina sp. VS9-1]|uniref:NUDIX domain-containing protein n=1 Tax=Candidatus Nanosalina sp. VS9-1 TaxID=3388566 RepID=UPI0039E02C7F